MNSENGKPVWLWVYYIISLAFFVLGIIIVSTDKTGFGILVAWPLATLGIVFAILSYAVYYSKKKDKKLVMKIILWILFLVSLGFISYVTVQTFIWYNSVGISWPIYIFITIITLLILVLLLILNKSEN